MSFFKKLIGAAAPIVGNIIAPGIGGAIGTGVAGLINDSGSARAPSQVKPLDLEELAQYMFVNNSNPYGSNTYTKDPKTGQYTGEYKFSPEAQAAFDRLAERAVNPAQAYQPREGLGQLTDALLQQRLAGPQRRERPALGQRPVIERPVLYRPRSSYPDKVGPGGDV